MHINYQLSWLHLTLLHLDPIGVRRQIPLRNHAFFMPLIAEEISKELEKPSRKFATQKTSTIQPGNCGFGNEN